MSVSEFRVEGPVLELQRIGKKEAGSYLCIASNGHPPTVSRRVQIDVKCKTTFLNTSQYNSPISVRPVVSVPGPQVTAMAGRKVQLECNVEAFPRAEVTWEFSSERGETPRPLESGLKYNTEEFLLSQYSTRTVLTITNFSKEVNTFQVSFFTSSLRMSVCTYVGQRTR